MVLFQSRDPTRTSSAPWPKLLALYAHPACGATTKARLFELLRSQMPSHSG